MSFATKDDAERWAEHYLLPGDEVGMYRAITGCPSDEVWIVMKSRGAFSFMSAFSAPLSDEWIDRQEAAKEEGK